MMKKTILIGIAILAISACQQHENFKAIREEVMKIHDKVMNENEQLINNEMKLDTLAHRLDSLKKKIPSLDTLKESERIKSMASKLTKAENMMNDWMHNFEPNAEKMTEEEAVKYFTAEKEKITQIEKLYQSEIKSSNDYLLKFKK